MTGKTAGNRSVQVPIQTLQWSGQIKIFSLAVKYEARLVPVSVCYHNLCQARMLIPPKPLMVIQVWNVYKKMQSESKYEHFTLPTNKSGQ